MKASHAARQLAFRCLRSRGMAKDEAIGVLNRVTPQRIHQLARAARGLCEVCCKPNNTDGRRCDKCRQNYNAKKRSTRAAATT